MQQLGRRRLAGALLATAGRLGCWRRMCAPGCCWLQRRRGAHRRGRGCCQHQQLAQARQLQHANLQPQLGAGDGRRPAAAADGKPGTQLRHRAREAAGRGASCVAAGPGARGQHKLMQQQRAAQHALVGLVHAPREAGLAQLQQQAMALQLHAHVPQADGQARQQPAGDRQHRVDCRPRRRLGSNIGAPTTMAPSALCVPAAAAAACTAAKHHAHACDAERQPGSRTRRLRARLCCRARAAAAAAAVLLARCCCVCCAAPCDAVDSQLSNGALRAHMWVWVGGGPVAG